MNLHSRLSQRCATRSSCDTQTTMSVNSDVPIIIGNHTIAPRAFRSPSLSSRGSRSNRSSTEDDEVDELMPDELEDSAEAALDSQQSHFITSVNHTAQDHTVSNEGQNTRTISVPSQVNPVPSSSRSGQKRGRGYTIREEMPVSQGAGPSGSRSNGSSLTAPSDIESESLPMKKRKKNAMKHEDSDSVTESESDVEVLTLPGDIEAAERAKDAVQASSPPLPLQDPAKTSFEPVSEFTCPVCFAPPTYATATLCGHVRCGECLFSAVNAQLKQNQYSSGRNVARYVYFYTLRDSIYN